jgi:stage V sporulation protein D (sporulation-specific penicillin-binding protein)
MVANSYHDIKTQQSRTRWMLVFIVLFTALVISRLFYLQVVKHEEYLKIAASQHWAKDTIPAKRGTIYVKDEMTGGLYPLAKNQTLQTVFASPQEMIIKKDGKKIDKKEEVAKKIALLADKDPKELIALFDKNKVYAVIKKEIEHELAEKIKKENLPGIYLSDQSVRYYPEGSLASQLLGYVDSEGRGNYGIEQYFNEELSGVPGLYQAEIDPAGKRIAFGNKVQKPARDGADLILTINRDVQAEAERLLSETVEKFKAEKGSIIVMNPENGEVIAMANNPTYDPNSFKEVKDYSVFKNSAATDVYEPGSIFKTIIYAAGLDQGKIEPDSKYEDTGNVKLNGYKIMNSDKKSHGWVDMSFAMAQSLNTGTVHVLNLIGKDIFYEYIKKFGFGLITGIEQNSEGEGLVFKPSEVNDHGYATISFGQSITTTPIQMITAYAALANGGSLVKPHLVAEKIFPDGKKEKTKIETSRVISAEAATKEKEMMVDVVESGHGRTAKVKGYKIAGKTGTAQVPKKDGRGYDTNRNIGSFIGYAPADSPRFVVMSKIDSPKGVPWAESSAAPIVGKMFDFLFKYYQVPPTEPF